MLSYNLINVYISWKKGGVFLAAIDSAYHYYLSTYGTSKVSRYDTIFHFDNILHRNADL